MTRINRPNSSSTSVFFKAVGVLALVAACLVPALPAAAQSISQIEVNIPFAFTVGKKTLPAGEYTLTSRGRNILLLRAENNEDAAIFTTSQGEASSTVTQAQFAFNKYGDEYFLTEIRPSYDNTVFRLARTRQEDRLAKSSTGPEVVTLAANRK